MAVPRWGVRGTPERGLVCRLHVILHLDAADSAVTIAVELLEPASRLDARDFLDYVRGGAHDGRDAHELRGSTAPIGFNRWLARGWRRLEVGHDITAKCR